MLMETLERVRVRQGERKVLTEGEYRFINENGKVVGKLSIGRHPAYVRRIEGVRVFRVVRGDE